MNFEDLILEELKSDTVELTSLDEALIPLNVVLAFFSLKRNAIKGLKKITTIPEPVKREAKDIKADVLSYKEKLRADKSRTSGKGTEATVYNLDKKQLEVLSSIQEKYGAEIIDEVIEFRKNILAPYQVIKRLVKSNKTITSKDKFGMTHSQYRAAVDSGTKKIEKRGTFSGKNDDGEKILEDLNKSVDALRELRKDFIATGRLKEGIVGRVLKYYDLGTADFEESLDDLRKTFDELKKNERIMIGMMANQEKKPLDPFAAQELVKRNIELRKGIIKQERESGITEPLREDVDYTTSESFKRKNVFNVALGKYMLRRNIIDELKVEKNNRFKKTYISIIDKMMEKAIERKKEVLDKKIKGRSSIDFNEIERRIFKTRPGIKQDYSSNINDYVKVIKDEDFTDPEYVKRPDDLIEAENKIEAEVKRFERFLQKELEPEDYNKLKKYRLINNFITVGDLKNPNDLFKSPEEIRAMKRAAAEAESNEEPAPEDDTEYGADDEDIEDIKNIK